MLERSYNNTNIKKGDRKLSNNYRPINLTVIFCRMLEAIIRDKIMSYFASNGFFCSEQFRFRSKWSCETQLLMIIETWSRLIEDGTNIDAIYRKRSTKYLIDVYWLN